MFDDHPMKTGKYSCINNSMVFKTSELIKKMPNICIITAYLHSKKIIKSNLEYLFRGGSFVILHPIVKEINKSNYKNFLSK
jgi:hypothetical protein